MTHYIRHFGEISMKDVTLVGGKGANLGEMTRAGLPVPPGFCVNAAAYREFTKAVEQDIAGVLSETRMDDPDDVENKTARLREFLIAQPLPDEIAEQAISAYRRLEDEISGNALNRGKLPVAVRSSATAEDLPDASFAGQQDTYLNIRGDEQLLEYVKRCWASLWTARAVTYRHKQGYDHDQVALAVVVQAMIESEVAGVLFTANPINNRRDEMVLNASWGLGEAIVSGLVTPDTWIAQKGGEILERDIARKEIAIEYAEEGGTREVAVPDAKSGVACLSDEQVRLLVALGERIEEHYTRPMDIEWARARETFYMLQARPITTLGMGDGEREAGRRRQEAGTSEREAVSKRQEEGEVGASDRRFAISDVRGEYNRSMFIEIFPDPLSPAFLSVVAPLFHSMLAFTFETLGFEPPQTIPAIGVFYNQPYFHREYIQAALAPLSPPVREALVTQVVNPFGKHERNLPTEASLAYLGMVRRLLGFLTGFPKQLPGLLAAYHVEIEKFNALPFEKMPDGEIMTRVRDLLQAHASKLLNYDFLMIALIGITYQTLGSLLERYYGEESEQVRARLISGVTGNVTMETNKKLWDLAQEAKKSASVRALLSAPLTGGVGDGSQGAGDKGRESRIENIKARRQGGVRERLREKLMADGDGRIFLAQLDAFLERYGHREVQMDILYPTWGEDPTPVLQFVRRYFDADENASPHAQQARLVREREQLAREVDERVQRDLRGRIAVAPIFHWVLHNTQTHTRERDTMHFELTRLFPPFRRALLELGARWQKQNVLEAQDDIFFLTLDEMDRVIAGQEPLRMQALVKERRAEFEYSRQHGAPALLRDGAAVETVQVRDESAAGQLRGVAGSPGRVSGIVRVIRGPQEFEKLQRGEILVAPLTNPVWTPLFAIASGIVTQVGGILSHGAIVAREYGIPAVMAVRDATTRLQDGQRVTVDGNKGIVSLDS